MREAVQMGVAKVNVSTCLAVKGEGFTGTPRGNNFEGVNRTPARGMGKGKGKGGEGKRHKRKGEGRSQKGETKASPLKDKNFDREICNLCITECPIGCKAITMEETSGDNGKLTFKPNVLDGCTGCGVCVMVCPTDKPSIIVEPLNQNDHV